MPSPIAVARLIRLANQKFPTSEEGQDLLEYGLLAALIAIAALGAASALGQTIYTLFWQTIPSSL